MAEEELEKFRREWQAEVQGRDNVPTGSRQGGARSAKAPYRAGQAPQSTRKPIDDVRALDGSWNFDNLEEREKARQLGQSGSGQHPEALAKEEPKTALEFYEKAVDCEAKGRLGESLAHYRKAFRLNDRVDQQYKNKHFPPSSFQPNPRAATIEDDTAISKAETSTKPTVLPSTTRELISSFANARIEGQPPLVERAAPPKCPIADVPTEVLGLILLDCALTDVASFMRLSLVCKRLAYLVATEDSMWKRVCHDSKFGLGGMHYDFACEVNGKPLEPVELPKIDDLSLRPEADPLAKADIDGPTHLSLPLLPTYPSYAHMFRHRPRIRFSGVYISTVNYVRAGQSSPNQLTWNTPVHVVTYFRYLRFYRDGTCISLLTTVEPPEVVPFLKLEHIDEAPGVIASPGLGAVSKHTLRGRWRLSPLHEPKEQSGSEQELEPEGNVLVETAGPMPAYTYSMQLALRSAGGRGPKNTKLAWRGFWSYNKITDDWAEFRLRNDRAFVWSRVKSWSDA